MVRQLQRFDFGNLRDFRDPIQLRTEVVEEIVEAPPPPPPPPSFNEDQLQQARLDAKKLGYNEGFLAGMAQAQTEFDSKNQQAQDALIGIGAQVTQLAETYNDVIMRESFEVSELALVIARKVAAEALDARSVDVIAALVARCLPVIYNRPKLVIELHPDVLPQAEPKLKEYLTAQGFEGYVQFRDNPALSVSDVRVDWATGLAERSTDALWKQVESVIAGVPTGIDLPPRATTQPTTDEPTGE